jgi:hypothetical protein
MKTKRAMKMLLTANTRLKMMTALLIAPLLGEGAQALAAPPASPDLPAEAALTNLRSPTGRNVYLLLRQKGTQGAQAERSHRARRATRADDPRQNEQKAQADPIEPIRARANRIAAGLSPKAAARVRAAGTLIVIEISHPDAGLNVHRHGRRLTVDAGPPTPILRTAAAGVRLRPREGQPESDLDQEILLQARRAFRDKEEVPGSLVALAQGAAARALLSRYAAGDDLGAVLFAARHAPLLAPHPDAALLREVQRAADDNLDAVAGPGEDEGLLEKKKEE